MTVTSWRRASWVMQCQPTAHSEPWLGLSSWAQASILSRGPLTALPLERRRHRAPSIDLRSGRSRELRAARRVAAQDREQRAERAVAAVMEDCRIRRGADG